MDIEVNQDELKDSLKIIELIENDLLLPQLTPNEFFYQIDTIRSYCSGGGCNHLFFHLKNKHILAYHYDTETIEYSYDKYNHIYDYIDSDDDMKGFGYEANFPKYEKRSVENINLRDEGI